jgi:hypothetical protein
VRRSVVALGAVATIVGLAFAPLPVEDTTRIHSSVETRSVPARWALPAAVTAADRDTPRRAHR